MKLTEIWQTYDTYTKATSDAIRQVAFAGIAAVWVFKVESNAAIHLDQLLIVAGLCFVIGLSADFLQYAAGVVIFQALGSVRRKKKGAARDADNPVYLNWPIDMFFWAKMLAVIVGYGSLFLYLARKLT